MSMPSTNQAQRQAGFAEPAAARSESGLPESAAAAPQLRRRASLLAWFTVPRKSATRAPMANGPWRQHTWSGPCE